MQRCAYTRTRVRIFASSCCDQGNPRECSAVHLHTPVRTRTGGSVFDVRFCIHAMAVFICLDRFCSRSAHVNVIGRARAAAARWAIEESTEPGGLQLVVGKSISTEIVCQAKSSTRRDINASARAPGRDPISRAALINYYSHLGGPRTSLHACVSMKAALLFSCLGCAIPCVCVCVYCYPIEQCFGLIVCRALSRDYFSPLLMSRIVWQSIGYSWELIYCANDSVKVDFIWRLWTRKADC